MGHNVDLSMFGITNLNCQRCNKPLDLEEVDIDCDIKVLDVFKFELNTQCYKCDHQNEFVFGMELE